MRFFDLEPVSWSSNYDDDEVEEAFIPKRTLEPIRFEWIDEMKSKLHNDDKLTCHKLLIALKPAASCFLHQQFQEKHLLANIVLPEVDVTKSRKEINRRTCRLYSLQKENLQTLVLITQFEVLVERAYAFAQVIYKHIDPQETFIFDTILPVNLSSSKLISIPSIYMLETEKVQVVDKERPCGYLESPSLIEKATAALLTYCQVRGLHSTAFISVEDPSLLESDTLRVFEKSLQYALGSTFQVQEGSYHSILRDLNARAPNPLFT